jgi:transcriptional regulator with XRE-family HTH domain
MFKVLSMTTTIGQKISYFRKREGLSQMDLENLIHASNGSISKMENNQTNPTKETLLEIGNVLKLDTKELNYLIGISAEPVSETEIIEAKKDIEILFQSKDVLGYLIDDRGRFISISQGFINFFNLNDNILNKFIGKSFINFVLNPQSHVIEHLSMRHIQDTFVNMLSRFYADTNFIQNDVLKGYLNSL